MALLDAPRDVLTVYPPVQVTDDYGETRWEPSDTGVQVVGRVQAASTDEATQLGQIVGSTYRFIGRDWPGDHVPFGAVEWRGSRWQIVGDIRIRSGSGNTKHCVVYFKVPDTISDTTPGRGYVREV